MPFAPAHAVSAALTSARIPSNLPRVDTMKLLLGATVALLLGALAVSWQGMRRGVENASPDEIARLKKQVTEAEANLSKTQALLSEIDRAMFDPASARADLAKLKMGELSIRRGKVAAELEAAELAWLDAGEALEAAQAATA